MGVMGKLLFGSGFPNDTPARVIESIYTVNAYSHGTQLPSIPRHWLRGVVEKDSLACLGINAEFTSRHTPDEGPDSPMVEVVRFPEPEPAELDEFGDPSPATSSVEPGGEG